MSNNKKPLIRTVSKNIAAANHKVLIAIPYYHEEFHIGFVSSLMNLHKSGASTTFIQSTILPQSRDSAALTAISNNFTHLLFIDSDMTFPPDALEKLLARNVDIVTGLAVARKGNHEPCIYKEINYKSEDPNTPAYVVETDIDRDFFEIKGCGMAFCLIKTSVLNDIQTKYGNLFRYLGTYGEDLSFCIRALEAGYKIYCDTTFELGHIGSEIFFKNHWIKE